MSSIPSVVCEPHFDRCKEKGSSSQTRHLHTLDPKGMDDGATCHNSLHEWAFLVVCMFVTSRGKSDAVLAVLNKGGKLCCCSKERHPRVEQEHCRTASRIQKELCLLCASHWHINCTGDYGAMRIESFVKLAEHLKRREA
jgi:hypothetical protein